MTTTAAPGAALSPELEAAALVASLEAGAGRLAELVAGGVLVAVPVSVATEWTQAALRTADRLTAVGAVGAGTVDRATPLIDGRFISARAWIETSTRTSGGDAAALTALGRDLTGDYAVVATAWLEGSITRAAARELTVELRHALRPVPTTQRAAQRTQALGTLVPFAQSEPVASVRRAVKGLRFVLDPDGTTQAALDAHDESSLRVSFTGPRAHLSLWTTAETGAALLTVLDQQVAGWFRDGAVPAEEPRDPVYDEAGDPTGETRAARYRREHLLALAFAETLTTLLDRGLVGTGTVSRPT